MPDPARNRTRTGAVVVLGIFVADTAYRTDRLPRLGETILGNAFALGPGGKGSNQAVAAARAGAETHMLTRLGADDFGAMARAVWADAGVTPAVREMPDGATGAACILVEERSGNNAIVVAPGVASDIDATDIDAAADLIAGAAVFLTQLEQPLDAAHHALRRAREAGVATILNPAPAANLPDDLLPLCDYLTPNETEAEALTGLPVGDLAEARAAAAALRGRGVGTAIVTLGENGVLFDDGARSEHLPALSAGAVVETTGAGDAFNGGFAAALARGKDPLEAARFGNACAALSVTRPGAAASMPDLAEVEALLARA